MAEVDCAKMFVFNCEHGSEHTPVLNVGKRSFMKICIEQISGYSRGIGSLERLIK